MNNININLSYIVVKSMKANEANPRVNDNDHKFLLKGITPFSFENPHKPPANMPKNSAQANHLLTLGFHSEKESKVQPHWHPRKTKKIAVREPKKSVIAS